MPAAVYSSPDPSDEEIEEAGEATPAADISGGKIAEAVQATQAMQDAENSSPGPGPRTRRRRGPGNLWTLEAREDMFRRREAGEGWETIILVGDPGALSVHSRHRITVPKLPKLPSVKPSDPFLIGLPKSIPSCNATTVLRK